MPRSLRLTVVGPTHPYKGGVAQHTTELATRLADAGHVVRLESWSRQYPDRLYPGQQRVTEPEAPPYVDTTYPLSWRRPDSWWRAGRRMRRRAPDAVVVVLVTPLQILAYLTVWRALTGLRAGRSGPRRILLCHNVLPHEPRPGDVVLTRALLRRATGVLVHGETERRKVDDVLQDAPQPPRVQVAPLPPHLPGGRPEPADLARRPVRRRLAFFGIVRPYKGLDVLLQALARGPHDVGLVVAGEFWGGIDDVRTQVTELGLEEQVELRPGYVPADAVADVLATADALVMPYREATASQNVGLAVAHGLVPVVSRTGTLADGVRDGENGFVVTPGDVDDLASALRRLYEPGAMEHLRHGLAAGVERGDDAAAWGRYLAALEVLVEGPP